ncbi:hypothetical protein NPIL_292291 [Nephila pilipes]|uniref:Uncharacterized protein n=1 Tax=Nephila pilipes TaxID=299642 RepID=A0A8X6T327_NEPPI|nr:hypothetical protein NPIL_292291 [Nephila pilipes]
MKKAPECRERSVAEAKSGSAIWLRHVTAIDGPRPLGSLPAKQLAGQEKLIVAISGWCEWLRLVRTPYRVLPASAKWLRRGGSHLSSCRPVKRKRRVIFSFRKSCRSVKEVTALWFPMREPAGQWFVVTACWDPMQDPAGHCGEGTGIVPISRRSYSVNGFLSETAGQGGRVDTPLFWGWGR